MWFGGLRPHWGLTVLQKPPNFTGRDKGKAFALPPPQEAASALVNLFIPKPQLIRYCVTHVG
jgi:hypothetical protein